jgi:hypothetical protein
VYRTRISPKLRSLTIGKNRYRSRKTWVTSWVTAIIETTATTSNAGTYKADISYRYKVKGVNYSSSRIFLLDFSSTAGRAESIVQNYPDKSTVRVYYNPSDFSESVLEPGGAGGINLLYILGGIFATAGLFFLIMNLTGHVHTSR